MTAETHTSADGGGTLSVRRSLARSTLPFGIVVGWIVLEVALRRGLVSSVASDAHTAFAVDWAILAAGFPLFAVLLGWIATRRGRAPDEWGYDWSRRAVLVGVGGIVAAIAITAVTGRIDAALFSLEQAGATFGDAIGEVLRATPALAALFIVGNGILVPIAEEAVWRGIVQTEFVDVLGPAAGIALTAVLFAMKHVIVDLSVARVTTLLALALVLGVIRHRYGTGSSTITHVGVNLLSSASIVAVAFA